MLSPALAMMKLTVLGRTFSPRVLAAAMSRAMTATIAKRHRGLMPGTNHASRHREQIEIPS